VTAIVGATGSGVRLSPSLWLAIHANQEARPGDPIHLRRPGKLPLSLVAVPIRIEPVIRSFSNAAVVVFVSEPGGSSRFRAADFAAGYGLTAAEARLFEVLAAGERISDDAGRVQCSVNTANTHPKQIFSKTGTHRQAGLVRLVAADLAPGVRGSGRKECGTSAPRERGLAACAAKTGSAARCRDRSSGPCCWRPRPIGRIRSG
jgi:DNA-binding CsgD family transcriptional regulator